MLLHARHTLILVWSLAALCLVMGCGQRVDKWAAKRPKTYPAKGRVLWDGKPEAGVVVSFDSPSHNVSASGFTDADGGFTLQTFKSRDGAVAGDHVVRLEKRVIKDPSAVVPVEVVVLPPIYANPAKSGLKATVTEKGPNEFTFEVTGPRGEP